MEVNDERSLWFFKKSVAHTIWPRLTAISHACARSGRLIYFRTNCIYKRGRSRTYQSKCSRVQTWKFCAFDGGQWLRVSATVVRDDRLEPKKHMLDAYLELQGRYQADDGNTEVLYLKEAPPRSIRLRTRRAQSGFRLPVRINLAYIEFCCRQNSLIQIDETILFVGSQYRNVF